MEKEIEKERLYDIFEGEYLNGMKNGKGKDNDKREEEKEKSEEDPKKQKR